MKTKAIFFTTKIMIVIVLSVVIAAKAFSNEPVTIKMVPYELNKAIIAVDNKTKSTTETSISDDEGDVIYYSESNNSKENYTQLFDFKNLKDGKYTIEVKNATSENTVCFKLSNNKFSFIDGTTQFVAYYEVVDNILQLTFVDYDLITEDFKVEEKYYLSKVMDDQLTVEENFSLSSMIEEEFATIAVRSKRFNLFRK